LGLYATTRLGANLRSRFDVLWSSLTYKDLKNGALRPAADGEDGLQRGKQTTYRFSNNYDVNDSHQINFGLESSYARIRAQVATLMQPILESQRLLILGHLKSLTGLIFRLICDAMC
jgi:hypothetical protein